jgi:hypothetical protein
VQKVAAVWGNCRVGNMTNADSWARVVRKRTAREDLLPRRVWTLHKGEHAAAIDLKAVPGIGAEVVLTADGELRQEDLSRSHEQAELVGGSRTRGRCSRKRGGRNYTSGAMRCSERTTVCE